MPVDSNLNIRETAAMVEKQVLSIRFRPDGLTFIRENIADNLPVSAHKTCMIEPGYGSHVEAFQELFFRNQELCLPYNKVRIYYEPSPGLWCLRSCSMKKKDISGWRRWRKSRLMI
ncbi:DUF3822 family protein [Porphyromonas macacae]|uniref:DUF3822 family protein n=1 Tax=Porphyromonas macacae TaxID=28115 RepID=UPI0004689303|nr:DUF3822 family protein [Porphyromonas macacae]